MMLTFFYKIRYIKCPKTSKTTMNPKNNISTECRHYNTKYLKHICNMESIVSAFQRQIESEPEFIIIIQYIILYYILFLLF